MVQNLYSITPAVISSLDCVTYHRRGSILKRAGPHYSILTSYLVLIDFNEWLDCNYVEFITILHDFAHGDVFPFIVMMWLSVFILLIVVDRSDGSLLLISVSHKLDNAVNLPRWTVWMAICLEFDSNNST